MRDYLHTTLDKNEMFEMGSTALAHIGDAVFELMVRGNLCKNGKRKAKELHKNTVLSVSASAQEKAAEKIIPLLTDEERNIFLRGRNAKVNTRLRKHITPQLHLKRFGVISILPEATTA